MSPDTRLSGEQIDLAAILNLAANLPKISLDDPCVIANPVLHPSEGPRSYGHEQFGNNFYLLFSSIFDDNPTLKRVYLSRAKALGQPRDKFIGDNEELLAEIKQEVHGLEPYHVLGDAQRQMYKLNRFDDAEAIDHAVNHSWGIEAIGTALWDRLNPLLSEAASEMEQLGIEPRKFFG